VCYPQSVRRAYTITVTTVNVASIASQLGLAVQQKPYWVYESPASDYRVELSIAGTGTLVIQTHGYATLEEMRPALELRDAVIGEVFGGDRRFVLVEDFSNLRGASLEGRRYYIQRLRKLAPRLLAVVFSGATPLMQLSIRLGRRLNIGGARVRLVRSLPEAIRVATEILVRTGHGGSAPSGLDATVRQRPDGTTHTVVTHPDWSFETADFCSHAEVIDGSILHVVSRGRLSEEHVTRVIERRERARAAVLPGRGFDYLVSDLSQVHSASRRGRILYVNTMKEWHRRWPLRMFIFCGVNRFMRAAINLGRPFVHFKVRIAENCEHALQLIERDMAGDRASERPVASVLQRPRLDPELLQPYVDELLAYLGSLDWESRGMRLDPVIDPDNPFAPVLESIALIRDEVDDLLTERKQGEEMRAELEAKLQRAQKMEAIGTLAGGVAHDLNNILAGLVTYPDLLLLKLPPDSTLREPIEKIKASGERAATIVQDMLTLARRGIATRRRVDLNRIVSDYLASPEHRQLLAHHPTVRVEARLGEDLPPTTGSPVHLGKAVMNLISNAVEAMPDGGTVSVTTALRTVDEPFFGYEEVEPGEYLTVVVADMGIGIAPRDLDRIFEPFYTKKVMGRSGTGLGMSLVWGTVKDHRGFLDVVSTEGQGTTFTLFVPVIRSAPDEGGSRVPLSQLRGQGETILVVEDMPEQRDIATEMLTSLGYRVTTVAGGEEAVERLRAGSFDLVVLDMIMDPGIDGLDTYRRMLELRRGQRAIIASGYSETERVKEARRLGVGAYVRKPYLLDEIGLAIRQELDRP